MSIPGYQEFMLPILKLTADGNEHRSKDLIEEVANLLSLSEEDKKELLPSQTQPTYYNRAMWARTYLKKAGLLNYTSRGIVQITEEGLRVLKENPEKIDQKFLKKYDSFKNFIKNTAEENTDTIKESSVDADKSPEEIIGDLITRLKLQLAEDLLDKIKENSPGFFENLVINLLLKMGYGSSKADILQNIGKSGDGGIYGVIKEDVLGLDKIYVQAKRWDNNIQRPEIQKFVGALHDKKAQKGVFIATSDFSEGAKETASNSNIVLINGKKLTELMIAYNLGVQLNYSYEIKKIDEDFFLED